MAGFRKAKAEQAAIKMGIYGPQGSGKTFTSLLLAEGLAKVTGKRVAYVDTERGTDFYCIPVPERKVHPEAFDFDALYTRSITDTVASVKSLNPAEYGVVVLDSMTHLWEATMAAYRGKRTSTGGIPMTAWGPIKKPYKELIAYLLSSPMHLLICGRQGLIYEEDEEGESKVVGVKMKAEGETPYEPHILVRMDHVRPGQPTVAHIEKDRTGLLQGKTFTNPTYATLCAPIVALLSGTQAHMATEDETAAVDAAALEEQNRKRAAESADILRKVSAQIDLAETADALLAVGKTITPKLKAQMVSEDVAKLRDKYTARDAELKGQKPAPAEPTNAELDAEIAEREAVVS